MPKNKIDDLRNILFETMEKLVSDEIDVERAKAVGSIAQVVVNTAKVEIEFMTNIDATSGTGFIPTQEERLKLTEGSDIKNK